VLSESFLFSTNMKGEIFMSDRESSVVIGSLNIKEKSKLLNLGGIKNESKRN
jgi:hypothetical protein